MTTQKHLVSVWNPAYAVDAMDVTVAMLLGIAREHTAGKAGDDDVYVWWGKVKSSNRQQPMPHLPEILALDDELNDEDELRSEMHLYLTDYRSLYVGHVAEITADNVMSEDAEHVPEYYSANALNVDCWFKLFDIRRIVVDDTRAVIEELRKLRNTHYNDRPVSIYGGMVDLPLVVTRDDGARFFEHDVRARLTDGKFWVEFDAERSGVGRMEQELRENLFGDQVWSGLDPAARGFIATAESIYRQHRYDAAFDFGAMAIEFAKAFEVQVNTVLRSALRDVPVKDRMVNVDGQSSDVCSGKLWSLGELARIIGQEKAINQQLKRRIAVNGEWFTASLPAVLGELGGLRNPAAHSQRMGRKDATALRSRIVGVGGGGELNELGRVRVR